MSARGEVEAGPLLAAVGGAALLVSLFLDWYDVFSAWTIFELVDLLLAGLALAAIGGALSSLGVVRWVPVRALPAIGALAFVVTTAQLLNHPPAGIDRDLEIGAWLGFASATLMLLGGIVSVARVSFAVNVAERDGEGPGAAAQAPAGEAPTQEAPTVETPPAGDETRRPPE